MQFVPLMECELQLIVVNKQSVIYAFVFHRRLCGARVKVEMSTGKRRSNGFGGDRGGRGGDRRGGGGPPARRGGGYSPRRSRSRSRDRFRDRKASRSVSRDRVRR